MQKTWGKMTAHTLVKNKGFQKMPGWRLDFCLYLVNKKNTTAGGDEWLSVE
jgi:hypothetical protein